MTLFDPYSHTRLHELRQERLERKVRRLEQLGYEPAVHPARRTLAKALRALASQIAPAADPVEQPTSPRHSLETRAR